MGVDRIKAQVRKTIELSGAVTLPRKVMSAEWEQAVCSATARVNEGWILPETKCNSAAGEELAAFLCAYGA